MSKELVISGELKGLEASKAEQIKAVFDPMVQMLKSFEGAYSEVMSEEQSPEKSAKAKRLRLDIAKVRIEADKARAAQKEEYLRAGNAIQGVYNILKFAVAEKEESLKEVETYYERIEAEKMARLGLERQSELLKYGVDSPADKLSSMDSETFSLILNGAIQEAARKEELERLEKEAREKAEAERIAEQERIRKENEALKAEREAREKELEAEREKIRLENEAKEKALKAEREKAEAERRKQEEQIKKEREAREAIERKAREEKEAREREEKKAAEEKKKSELAPDKEKLFSYAEYLLSAKDKVKSQEAKEALAKSIDIITKAANGM